MGSTARKVNVNDGICFRNELLLSGFRAELNEVAEGEAETSRQACEDELASRCGSEVSGIVHPSDCFLLVRIIHGFWFGFEKVEYGKKRCLEVVNPAGRRIFGFFSPNAELGSLLLENGRMLRAGLVSGSARPVPRTSLGRLAPELKRARVIVWWRLGIAISRDCLVYRFRGGWCSADDTLGARWIGGLFRTVF
jgi:hypothetical protein